MPRADLHLLAQVTTGHALLRKHLSQWQVMDSFCRLCDDDLETPAHLLHDCPALALQQQQLSIWASDQWSDTDDNATTYLRFFKEEAVSRSS